ncbi:YceI family protein [Uliginosibacterium flavum]|uniref:YceI family protein n=1 Tax=Uliginosibacterium flavum TaxID=1396831 RepID=A0ABV2TNN2_9RHOO
MKKIVLAIALACFALAATAAPETYSIDPSHSAVRFGYDHLGWTFQQHRFDQFSGKLTLDRAARTASIDVTIDANSINTGSALFNGQLKEARFFDAANHPSISFKADQAKFDGDKLVSITGDLNIKGISKPVTLKLNSFVAGPHPIQKKRDGIGANAVAKVNRSDFGMDFQVPLVADEVALAFTVQAFKDR